MQFQIAVHLVGQRIIGTTADYVGGIQYVNGAIGFIQTGEGRAVNNPFVSSGQAGTYVYEYDLTDHLSNVRYSFNKNPITGLVQQMIIIHGWFMFLTVFMSSSAKAVSVTRSV